MAKIYSKDFIESTNDLKPKEETVNFLLNYSKALSVINCNKLKFETFLNWTLGSPDLKHQDFFFDFR